MPARISVHQPFCTSVAMNTRTILVVDDIPLMRTMLVKYIKSLGLKILNEAIGVNGLEILEAANGADALDILHDYEVDLMFLDLMTRRASRS